MLFYLQSTSAADSAAGGGCCVGFVVILGAILVLSAISAKRKEKELTDARFAYQTSLARLKSDPTNANLRQQTLSLGRVYSSLTRKKKGVSLFDEMALSNDINAACAGATFTPEANRAPTGSLSIEGRLARLDDLRGKGLIDAQEYETRRRKILDDV